MGLKVAFSTVLLAVATKGMAMKHEEMPLFKHFELDAEPEPGTHFYPYSINAKRDASPEDEPVGAPGTYKEFVISPLPYHAGPPAPPPGYNPPPIPAGAWAYMPMWMPAHHGAPHHPAPAPYHPAPAPYHPAPAPYAPAPAPNHPGPFHPDKMPEFKTYSFRVVAPAPEPAPEPESDLLDIRQAKALNIDDSSEINELIDASPVKEVIVEEAIIPLEAPIEEAPIEDVKIDIPTLEVPVVEALIGAPLDAPIDTPIESLESLKDILFLEDLEGITKEVKVHDKEVSLEENSSEEDSSEENSTEEPIDSTEEPIDFSEVEDLPAPARVFRRISKKYRGYF